MAPCCWRWGPLFCSPWPPPSGMSRCPIWPPRGVASSAPAVCATGRLRRSATGRAAFSTRPPPAFGRRIWRRWPAPRAGCGLAGHRPVWRAATAGGCARCWRWRCCWPPSTPAVIGERLLAAVTPRLGTGETAIAASLDIWVTPPDYTGLPPKFLRSEPGKTIDIPIGSTLLAQVHGGAGTPELTVDGRSTPFQQIDKADFRTQAVLKVGHRIEVAQDGATLGSWPITIIPDNPPNVVFAKPPSATIHHALRLDYSAADDYGVESVKAVIHRIGGKPGDKLELDLPLPGLHPRQARATSYHDLTAHPWAGLPVEIRLVAADALGQTGESAPAHMILPERVFTNPVARAIIDQRRELAKDPHSRLAVAEILGDLQSRPDR